jgi:hypothetical protein
MAFALIARNKVIQIENIVFLVPSEMEWIKIPIGLPVAYGWSYIDGEFIEPVITPSLPLPVNTILLLTDAMAQFTLEMITKDELQTVYDTFISANQLSIDISKANNDINSGKVIKVAS